MDIDEVPGAWEVFICVVCNDAGVHAGCSSTGALLYFYQK